MATDFELVPMTAPETQQDLELVPFDNGVSGNIAEPLQPAPQPPPFVDSFKQAVKEIEDSGEPGWANDGVPEMTEQSATSFERIETEADKLNDEKSTYMLQQMWRRSLTGSIYRGTFDAEINQEMENQLEFTDKLMIAAGTLGPDIWLFGAGAAIPVASGAVKAMPLIARPLQAASSFGFFEGIRRTYMNAVLEDGDEGKLNFINLLGESLYETAKGSAIGATLGAGQQFRHKLFSEASNVLTGTAKAGSFLAAEATAVATLMSQMHNPGVLPTQEEFALSLALIFGFEGMGMANHAMSRTVRDANFMLRRLEDAKMREAEGWRNIRGGLRPAKPGETWTPEREARYEHTPATKVITAYERNGVHPMELAKMAEKDITIKEDLVNPLADKIRALEIEGGLPPEPPPIITEIKKNYRDARLGLQPTSDLVPEQAHGQPGQAAQTLTGPAPPPVRLQTPGIHQPIQIYVGEPTDMVTLPSGQQVMIPADRSRSLALSEDGLISNPMAIALAHAVAPGIQVRAGSEGIDPVFKKYPGQVGGYFSRGEIARNERIEGLEKSIQAGTAAVRGMRRQMRDDDALLEQRRLDEMNVELARLKNSSLEAKESAIVINRMLQDVTPGRQLQTVLHEVGHLLSFMNEGWEQIEQQPGGLYVGKTTGSSSLFYTTLSGYPGIIRSIFEFAQQNNLNYAGIAAEGKFLSRLWRLTSNEAQFTQDPYRQSGSELIADVVSVSLHRPDILQQYTPNLLKAMELFYEARPEVKVRVDEMNKMISEGRSWEYSSHALQSGFMRAEAAARKARNDQLPAAKQALSDLASRVQGELIDRYQPLWNKIADDSLRLTNTVQKYQFRTTIKESYVRRMALEVMKPLQEVGLSEYDAGELLFYRRVMLDAGRSDKFNAMGFTPEVAKENFDRLIQLHNNDSRIYEALDAVHDIRIKGPIKLLKKYGLVGDDYLAYLESNEAYVRFDDLSYYIKNLEKGYAPSDRLQKGQVLSDAEGKKFAQKGALGGVRNPLTATIERDLQLYDYILKTASIKEMITALIREDRVPIFREANFKSIAKHYPHMMKNYVEADFVTISYPQRRLDTKTGKYYTARMEYKVPKILSDTFEAAPNSVQRFVGAVANTPWSTVLSNAVSKDKEFGLTPRILVGVGKTIQGANNFSRAMMITFGGSFLAANLLSYDLLRSFVQLPRTNENVPFSGKARYPLEYFASLKDLMVWQFKGKMHDHIKYLMDEGLVVTGRRWTEDADNATLLSQIQGEYGGLGYDTKIWQPLSYTLGTIADKANAAMRRLLTATDATSKLSAYRHLKKGMEEGKYPGLTEDMLQVIIREQIGSPAYAIKGNSAATLNTFFLFYSSILTANRGDFRAFKRNPAMFALEWGTTLIPTVLMFMLAKGLFEGAMDLLFDDEDDSIMDRFYGVTGIDFNEVVGSYKPSQILATRTKMEMQGNWIIPLGMNDKGEGSVITFPLPQGAAPFILHNTTLTLLEAAHMAWKQDNTDKEAKDVLKGYTQLLMEGAKGTMEAMKQTQERAFPQRAPWTYAPARAYDILTGGNTSSRMHEGKEFASDIPEGERLAAAARTAAKDFGVPKSIRTTFDDDGLLDSLQELFVPSEGTNDSLATRSANVIGNSFLAGDGINRFFRTGNPGLTERIYLREAEARADTAKKRAIADKMVAGESLTEEEMSEVIGRDQLLNAAKEAGVKATENQYLELLMRNGKYAYPDVLEAAQGGVRDAQTALGIFHASGRKIPDLQEFKK